MMGKKIKHLRLKAALAAATLFAVQSAVADQLDFGGLFYATNPDTVYINNTAVGSSPGPAEPAVANEHVYSGGFSMKDITGPWTIGGVTTAKNAPFMAWCIDIYDNMQSTTYTLTSDTPIPAIAHGTLTADRITALERLASNDLALVHDSATSSAFQLAAWEIMAEESSTYSMTSGNFTAYSSALGAIGNSSTVNTAQYWLSHLGTAAPTKELYIWVANAQGTTQDLAVFAPIPEPETYAMMLAGLGLMGFIARRRRERDVV